MSRATASVASSRAPFARPSFARDDAARSRGARGARARAGDACGARQGRGTRARAVGCAPSAPPTSMFGARGAREDASASSSTRRRDGCGCARGDRGWCASASASASADANGAGDSQEEDLPELLKMSTTRAIWYVGWPTTVIGLLRSLFPLTDTFWVGKLGIDDLSALCSNAFAGWMLYLVCAIVGYGVHSKVSARVGAKDYKAIGAVLRDGLYGALFTYFALLALVPHTTLYTKTLGIASAATFTVAQQHLQASLIGSIGVCFSNVLEATLRGFGSMKPALWVTLLMVACNVVLDPLFIFGVGPFPELGVAGAAVGTSIANCVGIVLYYRMLVKDFKVQVPWTRPNWKALKDIVMVGGPVAVAGIVFAMVYVGMGRTLNSVDPLAITAMGLGQQFENIPFTVTEAFRIGASTIVGQWMGARNATRARDAGWSAIRIASLALIPFGIFFMIFAPQLVGMLTQNAEVASRAVTYMYWNFPLVSFMALECAVEGAFTGTGVTYPVLVCALLLNLSRLPLAATLAPQYGVAGVWFTIAITQIIKSLLKTVWLRKLFNDLIADERAGKRLVE